MNNNDFNPDLYQEKYRIKTTRLPNWDYSGDGWYFVTICTKGMVHHFGEIRDFIMGLNEIGCVAAKYWQEIPQHFKNVRLDEWVVMPNHVHGIVIIDKPQIVTPFVGAGDGSVIIDKPQIVTPSNVETLQCNVSTKGIVNNLRKPKFPKTDEIHKFYSKISPKPGSLSTIIRSFKSIVTKTINQKFPNSNFQWQPRFYDHIIESDKELLEIREYIYYNPQTWKRDRNKSGLWM